MDEPEARSDEAPRPCGPDEPVELRQLRLAIKRRLFRRAADEPLRLGRFVVLERLGEGGMGVVFSGYDPTLDRKVAIKVLRSQPGDEGDRQRLRTLREAQALARLAHPNVIGVFEVGELEGSVFIVMEFVRGVTLKRWLAQPRPVPEVVAALLAAGRGLLAAHRAGIVHRDFKPDNVMVGEDGAVRVLDFGLARLHVEADEVVATQPDAPLPAPGSEGLTRTGVKVGTPAYMAPEQWAGTTPDARSDQYSFCAVLYEALHGVRPNAGDTIAGLTGAEPEAPLPTSPVRAGVPGWLQAAVRRGLARAPEDRFPTLADLLDLLARDPEAARRQRRRWAGQIAAAIAATALLVVALGVTVTAIRRATAERQAEARREALREQIGELRGRGEAAEAARLLRTFVELPDHREAPIVARAYLDWAADEPEPAAAVDALASAYITARADADEHAALVGLSRRLGEAGRVAEAEAALAALASAAPGLLDDPGLAQVRLDVALHRRDLPTARALLLAAGDPDGWAPVLEDLSRTTAFPSSRIDPALGVRAGDLDGDGQPELVTASPAGEVRVLRGDPTLTPWTTLALDPLVQAVIPLPAAAGAGLLIADHRIEAPQRLSGLDVGAGGEVRLQQITGGTTTTLLAWPDSTEYDAVAADLAGDGRTEVYVGTGAYQRRLWRLDRGADGGWSRSPAYPPIDTLRSDINALAAGDLDGDGRPELIAAVGPWHAYDLRVLRAGEDGALTPVARRSFGNIAAVAVVRGAGGAELVLLKTDAYARPGRFPADQPLGAPAGLYFAALRDRTIVVEGFVPRPSDVPRQPLLVGDLDGDQRDEVVMTEPGGALALLRRPPGAAPRRLIVGGLEPLAMLDVDADGRAELLAARTDEPGQVVLLGAGDEALAPAAREASAARPAPAAVEDPVIAGAWARGEQLVAIGLLRRPADELAAIARLARQAASSLLLRSGELYALAGDDVRAAEQFVAAAADPGLAAEALAGAADCRRRLGEFAAAAALTRRWFAAAVDPAERAAAARSLAALERAAAPRPEHELVFTRPFDPAWRVRDPLALRRDPERRALSLWSSPAGTAAELPLVWDGGPAAIEVELEVDRVEWGVGLTIGIAGDGADGAWLGARLGGRGSFLQPRLELEPFADRQVDRAWTPVGQASRVRVRVEVYPGLDAAIVTHQLDGEAPRRAVRAVRTPTAGAVRLQLGSTLIHPGLVGHVWIHRIRLVGLTPTRGEPDADPAARRLADHDLPGTLAALPAAPAGSQAQLWRAEALAGLGDITAAAAELRAFSAANPEEDAPVYQALHHRLRRGDDRLALAARDGLGERYVDVLVRLLAGDDPRPVDLAIALAGGVDLPAAPRADLVGRTRQVDALYVRGRALAGVGRFSEATAAYAAGLALLTDGVVPSEAADDRRALLHEALLDLSAETGDAAAAERWIAALLASSEFPRDVQIESLQAQPDLARLIRPEVWAALAADPGG